MFVSCVLITFFILVNTAADRTQMYFREVYKENSPLQIAAVLSSHRVLSVIDCSLDCLSNVDCLGFNYRDSSVSNDEVNCQLSKIFIQGKEVKNEPKKWAYYTVNIDVSKSCTTLRKNYPGLPSGEYLVNPQNFSSKPFPVFCDMTSKSGIGVTVIGHDSEARTLVDGYEEEGSYKRNVIYDIAMERIVAIINESKSCEQFIRYECFGSLLFKKSHGCWVSRQGVKMNYWGGAEIDSGKCACAINDSCLGTGSEVCNCDANLDSLKEDKGFLTDRNALPVTQLRFGDTGLVSEHGFHTLGKLLCWG